MRGCNNIEFAFCEFFDNLTGNLDRLVKLSTRQQIICHYGKVAFPLLIVEKERKSRVLGQEERHVYAQNILVGIQY